MDKIERLGGVGYPQPQAVLPELLRRNYGRWVRHESPRTGVLKHMAASGEICLTLRLLMPMGVCAGAPERGPDEPRGASAPCGSELSGRRHLRADCESKGIRATIVQVDPSD